MAGKLWSSVRMVKKERIVIFFMLFFGCENFLTGPLLDQNPNEVDDVSVISAEALLVGTQVTMYGVMEGYLNRAVSMVMQQMSGLQTDYYRDYNCDPIDVNTNGRWTAMYGTGGLIDMNMTQKVATDQEKYVLLGISQMWEALIFSMAADIWGDIPYSQAASSDFAEPKFDSQKEVHDSILDLIDSAIVNFDKGQVYTMPTDFDFTFNADIEKWKKAAYTLKSRIYLNWAEVDGENYVKALDAAEQGIMDQSGLGDWKALHGAAISERNVWFQFFLSNPDYMGAGKLLVDMLNQDGDGRLEVYFLANGTTDIVGVSPGDSLSNASMLNVVGHFGMSWKPEIVSWYENRFIMAECHFKLGNEQIALEILNEALDGIEQRWVSSGYVNISIPRYSNISGNILLENIMNEKYKALFLNMQTFSDWRRTGYPKFEDRNGIATTCGDGMPRRLLYPELEKKTNRNAPDGDSIFERVQNDPF